jgi:hypothetical protein
MDALLCSVGATLAIYRATQTTSTEDEDDLESSYSDINKTVEYYDNLATDYDAVGKNNLPFYYCIYSLILLLTIRLYYSCPEMGVQDAKVRLFPM